MGLSQNPSPPAHLYSQELQLRLYQAFIFSIPILFSIILFLLFYLFYLKRRSSTLSSPPPILPITLNHHHAATFSPLLHTIILPDSGVIDACRVQVYTAEMGLKGELREKLPVVLFDEGLREKDSQCCVCLGEFEMKEELNQVPSCKHVFHVDCISHWLHSNSTCPLCRSSINPHPPPPTKLSHPQDGDTTTAHHHHYRWRPYSQQEDQPQEAEIGYGSSITNHGYS
ncbi:probable E3 ubiquitin-protein ligase RHA4A isoform X1 [Camellia sinensis]|uniref:probable E3 ubiquitin-protein ligase RHA4A isoform X1 n=1 Tax=Camellia sinensis TaxID=4442 RepID=UPI00103651D6|nr:probable E3 ubiquitin-protein ligase RHA4A isoform X1 [Camellia sinensis]